MFTDTSSTGVITRIFSPNYITTGSSKYLAGENTTVEVMSTGFDKYNAHTLFVQTDACFLVSFYYYYLDSSSRNWTKLDLK